MGSEHENDSETRQANSPQSVCFDLNGRNRYRDSPLRGGASLIALQLGRASIAERAEPSIAVAEIFFDRSA
jgi:hypothetical protein